MFQPRGAPGSIKVCKMVSRSGKTQFPCKLSLLGGKSWKDVHFTNLGGAWTKGCSRTYNIPLD